MNVTLKSTEVTRHYAVTDTPMVQLRFRQSQIIPERVSVDFRDGEWARMVIAGHRAKKDGTAGVDVSEETYSLNWGEVPAWAQPFTDFNYQPTT